MPRGTSMIGVAGGLNSAAACAFTLPSFASSAHRRSGRSRISRPDGNLHLSAVGRQPSAAGLFLYVDCERDILFSAASAAGIGGLPYHFAGFLPE